MKVLLLNPAYPFEEAPTPPFGLMSLAAYLLEQGVEVKIEDYIVIPYSKKHIHEVLDEFKPEVVGATGVTMNINTSLQTIKGYKEANPDIITVMGGPHVTFDAENILKNNSSVDYIVRGEGELTFIELLENLTSRSKLRNIKGISYRENGEVIHNEIRPFIEDINILPFPARNLVPLSKYKALNFPINMVTSRGCPYKCIFCVGRKMMGRKVRYFDVGRVVDEFEMLSTMGFRRINIVDDLFTSKKERCIAICNEIIKRGINHPWNAFARVDTVTKELLEKLKEAGCYMLCFGIESGIQEILDTIKKRTTIEKCMKAIQLCYEVGIEPMSSYILGLPGESSETMQKTLKFAEELNLNHGFHILAPFPGTEVREKKDEYKIKILTDDWDRYDANQAVSETEFASHNEIEHVVEDFNLKIDNHIVDLLNKRKRGEYVSEIDMDSLENLDNFCFARDLILMELVETYPGIQNGADINEIINDFILYIESKTEYSREEIRGRLINLFSINCLKVDGIPGETVIRWS